MQHYTATVQWCNFELRIPDDRTFRVNSIGNYSEYAVGVANCYAGAPMSYWLGTWQLVYDLQQVVIDVLTLTRRA
jgi:hypothetical protein